MLDRVIGKRRIVDGSMCFSSPRKQEAFSRCSKSDLGRGTLVGDDSQMSLIPGLPDDVAKHCLALVPRSNFPSMGGVCKKWRSFIQSKEFIIARKLAGTLEEWVYVLTMDHEGNESHWEVFDRSGNKHNCLLQMPGPKKNGFGVVALNGKLLIIAGYTSVGDGRLASADVYQYDSCLNSWSKRGDMNTARYDFACAEVNGLVYAVGGYGINGESLSSAEVYDPDSDTWTVIEGLRRPRWGCFACGFNGKLYVMGGRSRFTIGNSRFVDIYSPECDSWCEIKNGCVMVTTHAVLEEKLFCMEWKDQRKLAIYEPEDDAWKAVPIPLTGSSSMVGFRFGILEGKLLLFSVEEEPDCSTLLYDPKAAPGMEWKTCDLKPSGSCLCTATITA